MARDDDAGIEGGDEVERGALLVETRFVRQLGEDHAEAVFPERVARDEDAFTCAVEQQRVRIVAGRRERLPAQAAQLDLVTRSERGVERKARALLPGHPVAERVLVPARDLVRL